MPEKQLLFGVCLAKEKAIETQIPGCIEDLCRKEGIEVMEIDLSRPLASQGDFDVILHKVFDYPHEFNEHCIRNFNQYIAAKKDLVLLDPVPTVSLLIKDRAQTLQVAKSCELSHKSVTVSVPSFVRVNEDNTVNIKDIVRDANLSYPLIVKSQFGTGPYSRDMKIVFSEKHIEDVNVPCILQQFINHGGKMYKIFTVGSNFYVIESPSIKDLEEGDFDTVDFVSTQVTRKEFRLPIHPENVERLSYKTSDETQLLDYEVLSTFLEALRSKMQFSLLGVDVIVDSATGHYYVVDVNYFPGYKGVIHHLPVDLVALLKEIKLQKGMA